MGEGSNKVRMDVWVELGLGFNRFADKAVHRQRGRREPDGSFSVNGQEDLEYFFYCPHCPICLCHSEIQMSVREEFILKSILVESTTM